MTDLQAATGTSRFVEANGIKLHYLDYGTAGRRPMLCIHGGAAHAHWFDYVAPGFTPDHHVLSLDMRGHGDSAWADPSSYLWKTFAAYDPRERGPKGDTLMHHAPYGGEKTIESLFEKGLRVNERDAHGDEPIQRGSPQMVIDLVAAGADINLQDHSGDTPLHEAARVSSRDMMDHMIKLGANPAARNKAGQTPMQLAETAARTKEQRR